MESKQTITQYAVVMVLLCHRKYRGHTTRSELYGYRNGNKIEALELCMVPAGQEHTIGPRLVKLCCTKIINS